MNTQKVRMLLLVAMLTVMMVAGNVFPAAAAPALKEAPPLGCTLNGTFYPVGTVLHFYIPNPPSHIWMRCEFLLQPTPGKIYPKWVYYNSNPS